MTESEWLRSFNSQAMIEAVGDKGSDRLWRLFAVACVRTFAHQLRDARSRDALDVAERYADGAATDSELQTSRALAEAAARQAARDEWEDRSRIDFWWDAIHASFYEAKRAADDVPPCLADEIRPESIPERVRLPDVLREVFGNPFRWIAVNSLWIEANDGAARLLAETAYEALSFDLLPILADALEDGGCTEADLLSHLHGPGPHVRGCWALDLILGKG